MNEKYNGWSNYETWLLRVWLDDYGMFDSCHWQTFRDPHELAVMVRDWCEEERDNLTGGHGLFSDLLTAAFHRIDWEEISEAMCYDVAEMDDLQYSRT